MEALELTIRNESTLLFYKDHLGMKNVGPNTYQFPGASAELRFIVNPTAHPSSKSPNEGFWKIGITLPDVSLAAQTLSKKGYATSKPEQFQDIGYLCHLQDPDGISIELLAHLFHGEVLSTPVKAQYSLGSLPTLGQVTLRISDPQKSLRFYTEEVGLKLLSIQEVTDFGFTLYFLAQTQDEPPDPDLKSVKNREWLWQRPYTTLELQHRWGQSVTATDKRKVLSLIHI